MTEEIKQEEIKQEESKLYSLINGNKGLIIAIAVVLIAAAVAFFALTNFGETEMYKGMIEKVEQQAQELEAEN